MPVIRGLLLSVLLFPSLANADDVRADASYPEPLTKESVLSQTLSYGLPVVEIITVDGEEPTADPVLHPPGAMGASITNATKVPGSVTVYSPDGEVMYASGEYEKKQSGMTVKLRGNTSSYNNDKKPYKIKLQKKGDMLGRGDQRFRDKDWVLIRNWNFKTYFGKYVGFLTGQEWMPEGIFVNVVFNGEYRGLYVLQESIERNVDCRIDVAEDGFIMEHDPYWWNEDGQYLESADHPNYSYTFKYPDYEDATPEQLEDIHNCLKKYEASIVDCSYPEVIDVGSFARWLLAHDILGTQDGGGVNLYLKKNSTADDSPLQCGPPWDFDSAELNTDRFSSAHSGDRLKNLIQNKNNALRKEYVKLWHEVRDNVSSGLDSLINDLRKSHWDPFNTSARMDHKKWNSYEATSDEAANRTEIWYGRRLEWLDSAIEEIENELALADIQTEIDKVDVKDCIILNGSTLTAIAAVRMLTISGIDGSILFRGSVSTGEKISLPSGLWIVRAESLTMKIFI